MTWTEIGLDHLRAAKSLLDQHPRSSASRAYYAAHVLLAEALASNGYPAGRVRETPPHAQQASLIGKYLAGKGDRVVRALRSAIRRLYARRVDADYRRGITIDRSVALDSIRDASELLEMLAVR